MHACTLTPDGCTLAPRAHVRNRTCTVRTVVPSGGVLVMPDNTARRQYPTRPESVADARSDCRTFLESWGLSDANQSVSDVVLMVSELMTNAVTHGRVPGTYGRHVRLSMEWAGDTFRVEVRDTQDDRTPVLREVNDQDGNGRGLFIVDALSDKWGVRTEVIGKTVWAEKRIATAEVNA